MVVPERLQHLRAELQGGVGIPLEAAQGRAVIRRIAVGPQVLKAA